ncbi:putative trans-sulfuration enzyme protein [Pleurostoma richardsiae]|uniref:Trans-sulfuration enzyme protein n=1 Tax=Pleurostoma richardsiae TaxID=41990 RepID=A0AA38RVX5_9PEZI|nr:putative trans-sulfuration enzyme protein [Pleurostoma richardsiae]
MENDPPSSKRGRLMGKLFGRDKKAPIEEPSGTADLNDFFRGSSDRLQVAHAAPPMLAKLDTSSAPRYPNAHDIGGNDQSRQSLSLRQRPHTTRARKGLVVRFVETFPDIIGEGGDECEMPTVEIARRKRAQRAQPKPQPPPAQIPVQIPEQGPPYPDGQQDEFVPTPIKRTQTGYSSIYDPSEPSEGPPPVPVVPAGNPVPSKFLDSPVVSNDEQRRSFIEIHQAEMREAEGMAFAKAVRTTDDGPEQQPEETSNAPPETPIEPPVSPSTTRQLESPETPSKHSSVEESPSSQYSTASPAAQRWAAALWLCEEVIPDILTIRMSPVDTEVQEVRQTLTSALRKLTLSMKRNGFLPPEEAFLPQTIDKSVWIQYPHLSQDVISLLHGDWGSSLAAPQQTSAMRLLEALPLGDTTEHFCFGRFPADVFLMEQGRESKQFYIPCFLSILRPVKQRSLEVRVASQNGAVQLRIQENRDAGATWEDVLWRSDKCALEIKLPRGFLLVAQCVQRDFKFLWSMQDFNAKVQSTLYPRKDEHMVFRSTLRSFQYFDNNPQSFGFPTEAVRNCELGLFERVLKEGAAQGPRHFHRGFRIAVVTGPKTKTLGGINHSYLPHTPIQFGFLRGDQDDPALVLKFDEGRSNGGMVMSFNDDVERLRLHNLLIGTALHQGEKVFSEVPLVDFSISQNMSDACIPCLKKIPWTRAKVINGEYGGDVTPTVLAERLRVIVDSDNGCITDRVNIGPGELKIRLSVKERNSLFVLRHPQQDMTVALPEAHVPKELPQEMVDALTIVRASQTVRKYTFTSVRDLHDFESALTGYNVLFDGIASTFAISRRRMVVPIHKKWEAGATRIQVVQQETQTQLLVFFEDFHHGQSMSFALKGTDVYEAFGRGPKSGVKLDDAKFPLPRAAEQGTGDDMAFVSLDLPELPGEHDDISILFSNEADRDKLCSCLPAPVKSSKLKR